MAAGEVDHYALFAAAGQQMTINLTGTGDGRTSLVMWGADGTVYLSGALDVNSWSGALPYTQDYYIDVRSVSSGAVDYTLDVLIPPTVTTPDPMPQRIQFAAGATSAKLVGALPGNGIARYVLSAAAGQHLTLNLLQSGAGHAVLVLWGADGTVFMSGAADATAWSGTLPLSQDYFVDVREVVSGSIDYQLDVLIPPGLITPEPVPQRIQFAPRAISARVAGTLAGEGRARYVLAASAGQELTLNLTQSGAGHAILAMWGQDGTVYMSGGVDATAWAGVLPLTQDYFVDVRNVSSTSLSYYLDVTIPPITATSESVPERIQFALGATTTEISGSLIAFDSTRYVLGASAGQQMSVVLTDSNSGVGATLAIWGADGSILLTDSAGETAYYGLLPATQDYYIDVRSVVSSPIDYTLKVTIPPASAQPSFVPKRIEFAPGAISAQVPGILPANGTVRHVLGASAGQQMQVNLTDSGEGVNAILIIWGADGTVLISSHAGAASWIGVLPSTQDYYIDIRSASATQLEYLLEVTIPPA